MSIWKPITTAPLDGTLVWIGTRKFIPATEEIFCDIILARYDSWNRYWRTAEKGDFIRLTTWHEPEFWTECELPSYPELKMRYKENLK